MTGEVPEVHELWELRVPEKLVACEYAGLVRNRDFTLVAAGYTKASVSQVRHSSTYSTVDELRVVSSHTGEEKEHIHLVLILS